LRGFIKREIKRARERFLIATGSNLATFALGETSVLGVSPFDRLSERETRGGGILQADVIAF